MVELKNGISYENINSYLYLMELEGLNEKWFIEEGILNYPGFSSIKSMVNAIEVIIKLIDIKYLRFDWDYKIREYIFIKKYNYKKSIGLLNVGRNQLIWWDCDFEYYIEEYRKVAKENYYSGNYNIINFLEFTNLIINNKLIKIEKNLIRRNKIEGVLTLSVLLNEENEKFIIKYCVDLYSDIENVDFYLFSNYDIIIHFQKKVDDLISDKNIKIREDYDYIDNHLRNKILKNKNVITLRKFIESLMRENNYINSFFKERNKGYRI